MTAGALLAPLRAGWRYAWPAFWSERLALLGLLAWAALLRGLFLREPIRFDEAANALYYGDRSLLHAFGASGGNENHGLVSLSMWIATRLLGWSEAAVRLPTLLCGVALCWAVYAGLRWYTGEAATALAGAALAAVSPWLVFFSVNGRGYIWQAAVVALLVPLVLAVRRGTSIPAAALGLWAGGLTAAGAFAARSMLVLAVGLFVGAIVLTASRPGKEGRPFFLAWAASAAVLTLALYSVAIAANGSFGLLGTAPVLRQPLGAAMADTVSSFEAVWPLLFDSAGGGASWLAGAALVAGCWGAWRRVLPLAALAAAVVVAGLALTVLVRVGLYPRVLLPLAALLLPMLAVAGRGLPRPIQGLLLAVLLVGYPALWLRQDLMHLRNSTGDIPTARPLAAELLRRSDLRESLLVLPPLQDVGVAFYFRQASMPRNGIHGYGLGLQPEGHCEYRQALVFVLESRDLDRALREAGEASWLPRLIRSGAAATPVPAAGGALFRIPMAPCPSP